MTFVSCASLSSAGNRRVVLVDVRREHPGDVHVVALVVGVLVGVRAIVDRMHPRREEPLPEALAVGLHRERQVDRDALAHAVERVELVVDPRQQVVLPALFRQVGLQHARLHERVFAEFDPHVGAVGGAGNGDANETVLVAEHVGRGRPALRPGRAAACAAGWVCASWRSVGSLSRNGGLSVALAKQQRRENLVLGIDERRPLARL